MLKKINRLKSLKPLFEENKDLPVITPDTDVTQLPYQGFMSNQDYYCRLQASCFDLDSSINEIVQKRFTGNSLRNMSDQDAIECFKALENAKAVRTKQYIDLSTHLADDAFFRKQQELEKLRIYKNNMIDITPVADEQSEQKELDRSRQQEVLKLLQMAVMENLKNDTEN